MTKSNPTKSANNVKKPTQPTLTQLPARGPTHKVDTRAVRLVMSQLDENWLIRSLDERDYGIDLQLEYFDSDLPTGLVTFIQIKGTEESFENEESFSLPVKTLLYAELFSAPFFLFRTSLTDKLTRFAWLQKFSTTALPLTSPNWRYQESVEITLPADNDLVDNCEKFKNIVLDQRRQRMAIEFLRIEYALSLHSKQVVDNGEISLSAFCSEAAKKLTSLAPFIIGSEFSGKEDAEKLANLYKIFDNILLSKKVTTPQRIQIMESLDIMDTIKISFMNEDEIHAFTTKNSGTVYY
ncbi:DUF4365 domain-containing protein [Burkholderia sp. AU31624]|uniref:DUF4365 domain-containing protein n=1 Tax=Burkholderia sp. AU31624 TaxID=2879629 RepID=UPI001CF4F319|nr:DUF4365 domain-containing protein [Burkholderia sp. AU31624]MCA8256697.1 DUF4365 domain-containing protein [Burkholderia sp. AU31624]